MSRSDNRFWWHIVNLTQTVDALRFPGRITIMGINPIKYN